MTLAFQLLGKSFGRLLVKARLPNTRRGGTVWACVCACGKNHQVIGRDLVNGHTKSCGCWCAETRKTVHVTHGKSGTRAHGSWSYMIQRCTNSNNGNWHRYGGRGITVCKRWRSFENFLADMGERPLGLSLDRKDNNGHYTPDNCRWATRKQQSENSSHPKMLTHDGKTKNMKAWAKELGLAPSTLCMRLHKGWSLARALTKRGRE